MYAAAPQRQKERERERDEISIMITEFVWLTQRGNGSEKETEKSSARLDELMIITKDW